MKTIYFYYFTILLLSFWIKKIYGSKNTTLKEISNKIFNGEIRNIYHDNHIVYKDIFSVVEDVFSTNITETDSKDEKIFKDIIFSVPMKETIQIYHQIKEKFKSPNVSTMAKNLIRKEKKTNDIFNLTTTTTIIKIKRKSSEVIKNNTLNCFITPFKNTTCIHIFSLSNNNNYLIPKYKFHTCTIGKNFSAYLTAIFCYLLNQNKFKIIFGHLENGIWSSFPCHNVNGPFLTKDIINDFSNNDQNAFWNRWKHFVIIRNPIDRFLSAFTHLCAKKNNKHRKRDCFNCNGNMKCFLERLYIDILRVKKKKKMVNGRVKNHFYPQTALCDYVEKYQFIRYLNFTTSRDTFYDELRSVMKDSNIPDKDIFFIETEIRKRVLKHTTTGTKLREFQKSKLLNNPYLLDLAAKIYYQDFIAFNFSLPI